MARQTHTYTHTHRALSMRLPASSAAALGAAMAATAAIAAAAAPPRAALGAFVPPGRRQPRRPAGEAGADIDIGGGIGGGGGGGGGAGGANVASTAIVPPDTAMAASRGEVADGGADVAWTDAPSARVSTNFVRWPRRTGTSLTVGMPQADDPNNPFGHHL